MILYFHLYILFLWTLCFSFPLNNWYDIPFLSKELGLKLRYSFDTSLEVGHSLFIIKINQSCIECYIRKKQKYLLRWCRTEQKCREILWCTSIQSSSKWTKKCQRENNVQVLILWHPHKISSTKEWILWSSSFELSWVLKLMAPTHVGECWPAVKDNIRKITLDGRIKAFSVFKMKLYRITLIERIMYRAAEFVLYVHVLDMESCNAELKYKKFFFLIHANHLFVKCRT